VTPDDEVVAEHNGETATARRTARAQLSRSIEDGVMWRRDGAGYGHRRVAGKPGLCKKQSIQPAADNLVVQQRGLIDGGATVENADVYSLDQLIGGEFGSSARRPRIVFRILNLPATTLHLLEPQCHLKNDDPISAFSNV